MESLKTVQLRGNLKDLIQYNPYPVNEFNAPNWYVSLQSAAFRYKKNIDIICNVSCNFSLGQKYENNRLVSYEQILQVVPLKSTNEARKTLIQAGFIILIDRSPNS